MSTTAPPDSALHHGSVPRLAEGVELLGEMSHSGFREPPALIRRADGQVLQLTDLLYRTLSEIDGRRDLTAIAAALSSSTEWEVDADAVAFLVDEKLRPLGVLLAADGSEPPVRKSTPLLALRGRIAISKPEATRRLADPFAWLFRAPIVVGVLAAFVAAVVLVLLVRGIAPGVRTMLYEPEMILLVFGLTALSAGFHELGHAAACRYGGATPGVMGCGIYLVWPAFYTDVTDSYRLDRRGRLRTDLGGLYFNCIFVVGTAAVWAATGWEALLVLIPLQLLQMLHQLLPVIRLDGYHILADLTGVPDLFARIRPTLRSAIPGVAPDERALALKPGVRVVVTAWVVLVFPILFLSMGAAALALPRVLATAADSLRLQWHGLAAAWLQGDVFATFAGILSMFSIAIPVAGTVFIVQRMGTKAVRHIWRRTPEGRPRTALLTAAGVLALALALLWWPNGEYEPIDGSERWRAQDIARVVPAVAAGRAPVPEGGSVEQTRSQAAGATPASAAAGEDQAPTAVAAPARAGSTSTGGSTGDRNVAVAVNGQDGASIFRLAFSVRFVGDGVLDQTNAAIALASCTDCRTIALAFQLLLVIGDTDVAVPQNVALARNTACESCFTFASATQLILGFDSSVRLTDEGQRRLDELQRSLASLEQRAASLDAEALAAEVAAAKAELLDIVEDEVVDVEPAEEDVAADPAEGAAEAETEPEGTDDQGGEDAEEPSDDELTEDEDGRSTSSTSTSSISTTSTTSTSTSTSTSTTSTTSTTAEG